MPLINCPECNTEVSDSAATCVRCGFPINTLIRCPECGAHAPNSAVACANCGYPLDGASDKAAPSGGMSPSQTGSDLDDVGELEDKPAGKNKLAVVIMEIVLPLIAIVILAYLKVPPVKNFINNTISNLGEPSIHQIEQSARELIKDIYKKDFEKDIEIGDLTLIRKGSGSNEYSGIMNASYNFVEHKISVTVFFDGKNIKIEIPAPADPWEIERLQKEFEEQQRKAELQQRMYEQARQQELLRQQREYERQQKEYERQQRQRELLRQYPLYGW